MAQLPADQTESDQLQQTIMEEPQEASENYQKDIKEKQDPRVLKIPLGFVLLRQGEINLH